MPGEGEMDDSVEQDPEALAPLQRETVPARGPWFTYDRYWLGLVSQRKRLDLGEFSVKHMQWCKLVTAGCETVEHLLVTIATMILPWHHSKHLHVLTCMILTTPYKVRPLMASNLQMGKGATERFIHTISKWQRRDSNLGSLALETDSPTVGQHC